MTQGELMPGTYAAEFDLPPDMLDKLARTPSWRRRLVEFIAARSSTEFDVIGGGVQHNEDGSRVFAVAFRVADPLDQGDLAPVAVVTLPVALVFAGIAAILGVSAVYVADRLLRIRILDAGGDPTAPIPGPFDGTGGLSAAGMSVGLVALAWLASTIEKARGRT